MNKIIEYLDSLKYPMTKLSYRYILLTNEESERMDITDYVIPSGSLEVSYQQGVRRSFSLSLINNDNLFFPAFDKLIWIGTKVKVIAMSTCVTGEVFENNLGIFLLYNPSIGHSNGQKIISFQCIDKFGALNGTVGGKLNGTYEVPANTLLKNVVLDILQSKNGKQFRDMKPLILDKKLSNYRIPYTVSINISSTFGDLLVELANQAGADIFYDINGYLNIIRGLTETQENLEAPLWHFEYGNHTYFGGNYSQNWSSVINTVIVHGVSKETQAPISAIAINENPYSPSCVDAIGSFVMYIEDSNIYSKALAEARAKYELQKRNKLAANVTIQTEFLLHLDVDKFITITDSFYNISNEKFIITGLSIPLSSQESMSLVCVNSKDLPYYSGII